MQPAKLCAIALWTHLGGFQAGCAGVSQNAHKKLAVLLTPNVLLPHIWVFTPIILSLWNILPLLPPQL